MRVLVLGVMVALVMSACITAVLLAYAPTPDALKTGLPVFGFVAPATTGLLAIFNRLGRIEKAQRTTNARITSELSETKDAANAAKAAASEAVNLHKRGDGC